jgi:hypothetical protein
MRTFSGLDQVEQAVGSHLGHSDWHTITQEQIDLFAEATAPTRSTFPHRSRSARGSALMKV